MPCRTIVRCYSNKLPSPFRCDWLAVLVWIGGRVQAIRHLPVFRCNGKLWLVQKEKWLIHHGEQMEGAPQMPEAHSQRAKPCFGISYGLSFPLRQQAQWDVGKGCNQIVLLLCDCCRFNGSLVILALERSSVISLSNRLWSEVGKKEEIVSICQN